MPITAADIYALAPYAKTLGVEFGRLKAESVEARLPHAVALSTGGGAMHGGALMGLADVAAAVCAALNGGEGAVPVPATMESSTHFLRPVLGAAAFAMSRPLHVGRSTVTIEVDIHDDQKRLCTRVTQLVALKRPR
ncbi:1,4-dihydroxy-2-naphthoyl-CoA hydrolase [Streptomyces sp. B3I7]|uniref:PaaI family thioesterase n=1 Tax=Streptomyces sp. B3I7 TaxID=3042269 RepID=UPI002783EFE0|nr:PaaI family thioesterase [Streptomyces sp. B3I7]MDQ0808838.1 1,4-dihydroxy-2-naphthoyl-CoA hydrolase [Streptomyces sp. B3I7]